MICAIKARLARVRTEGCAGAAPLGIGALQRVLLHQQACGVLQVQAFGGASVASRMRMCDARSLKVRLPSCALPGHSSAGAAPCGLG